MPLLVAVALATILAAASILIFFWEVKSPQAMPLKRYRRLAQYMKRSLFNAVV